MAAFVIGDSSKANTNKVKTKFIGLPILSFYIPLPAPAMAYVPKITTGHMSQYGTLKYR